MKICNICKLEKVEEEFDIKQGGTLAGYCKSCRRGKIKKHYIDNKLYYKSKAKKNDLITIEKYKNYKENLSCSKCGLSFKNKPYLCDFHHIDNTKERAVGKLSNSYNLFLKEIQKCVPVCANCHREIHYGAIV